MDSVLQIIILCTPCHNRHTYSLIEFLSSTLKSSSNHYFINIVKDECDSKFLEVSCPHIVKDT